MCRFEKEIFRQKAETKMASRARTAGKSAYRPLARIAGLGSYA